MTDDLWVIVSGGSVVHGPVAWNAGDLSHRLGLLGWSVSLSSSSAVWRSPGVADFVGAEDGGGEAPELPETPAAILPCTMTCPSYDPDFQVRSAPVFKVGEDAVGAVYAVNDRPLAEVRAEAIARINREAGMARARFVTVTTGQEGTYAAKEREARAYAIDAAPDPARYPYLSAEATFTATPIGTVAAQVNATADAWTTINARIEGRRRGAVEKVKAAADVSAVAGLFPIIWLEE